MLREGYIEALSEEIEQCAEWAIATTSIAELQLRRHVYIVLRNAGIDLIGDVVKCSDEKLLNLKDFGRVSLREVRERTDQYKLSRSLGFRDYFIRRVHQDIPPQHSIAS